MSRHRYHGGKEILKKAGCKCPFCTGRAKGGKREVLKYNLAILWEFLKCIYNPVVMVKWIISQCHEWEMDRHLDRFDTGHLYHNKFDEGKMTKSPVWEIYNGQIKELRNQGLTLQAIGNQVGVTRERIRQILNEHYGTRR